MAVSIPVSADAASAISAIEQIRTALRRAGQEGKQFADIDFSHPEISDMAGDIQRVVQQMETLARVGRGATAAAVRSMTREAGSIDGSSNFRLENWSQNVNRTFTTQAERDRHTAAVGDYIFQGTRFAPPAPPAAPPPGAPPGTPPGAPVSWPQPQNSESGNRPSVSGTARNAVAMGGDALGALGGLAGPLKFLLGAAGVGKLAGVAIEALGHAQQEAVGNDQLGRRLNSQDGVTNDFAALRDSVRETAGAFWVTYGEAQKLSLEWARLTSDQTASGVRREVTAAGLFARGYGIDPGLAVQTFGQAKQMGGEDPREFAALIAGAAKEGGMGGQIETVMQALLRFSEAQARTVVFNHGETQGFAAMYAGMNAMGLPGLRGANAENLLGTVNSSIQRGGAAGEAGMAVAYRALAAGGIRDPFQAQYTLEGGMFQDVNGKTMYSRIDEQINQMYAGLPTMQRLAAKSRMFGINMHQAGVLEQVKPRDVTQLSKLGIDLDKINPSAFADILDVQQDSGPHLEARRAAMLATGKLSDEQRAGLQGASGDEGVRAAIVKIMAANGMSTNMGTDVQKSMADMENGLTAAATSLVPVISELKSATADLADQIGKLSTPGGDLLSYVNHSRPMQAFNDFMTHPFERINAGVKAVLSGNYDPSGTGSGFRNMRNNNPGNLKFAGQPGAVNQNGMAAFPSMEDGVAADLNQYLLYQDRDNLHSIRAMVSKATPPGPENPNVEGYIAKVAADLGVSPDAPIDLHDPATAAAYIRAVGHQEGGTPAADAVARGVARRLGTALPPSVSGKGAAAKGVSAGAGGSAFKIQPLEVIHRDARGNLIATEHAPVTQVGQPQASGMMGHA